MKLTSNLKNKINNELEALARFINKSGKFQKIIKAKNHLKYKSNNTQIDIIENPKDLLFLILLDKRLSINFQLTDMSFVMYYVYYDEYYYVITKQIIFDTSTYKNKYQVFDWLLFKENMEEVYNAIIRLNA